MSSYNPSRDIIESIEYGPTKTGEYPRIFPNFQNCARCENDLKNNKQNSLYLGRKYAWTFVLDMICTSRLTVRFWEQIMSADKYSCIFSRQMEAIVYLFPSFKNCACCEKYLKDNKHNSLQLTQKYARIFLCP